MSSSDSDTEYEESSDNEELEMDEYGHVIDLEPSQRSAIEFLHENIDDFQEGGLIELDTSRGVGWIYSAIGDGKWQEEPDEQVIEDIGDGQAAQNGPIPILITKEEIVTRIRDKDPVRISYRFKQDSTVYIIWDEERNEE